MGILISTNLFNAQEFKYIFDLLDKAENEKIGIEIFPIWNDTSFEDILKKYQNELECRSISFHEPYYKTEHSAKYGSIEYIRTMDYMKKTLEYAQRLGSKYIVYHHNNKRVEFGNKSDMVKISNENLMKLNELAEKYGQKIVVENCGVINKGNMLFNEHEFIELCLMNPNDVLIDIGHINCNKWNLESVIRKLSKKIVSYHLHNNYGRIDEHNRIYDGNLYFNKFMKIYKELTPNADLVLEYSPNWNKDFQGIIQDINLIEELKYNRFIAYEKIL